MTTEINFEPAGPSDADLLNGRRQKAAAILQQSLNVERVARSSVGWCA